MIYNWMGSALGLNSWQPVSWRPRLWHHTFEAATPSCLNDSLVSAQVHSHGASRVIPRLTPSCRRPAASRDLRCGILLWCGNSLLLSWILLNNMWISALSLYSFVLLLFSGWHFQLLFNFQPTCGAFTLPTLCQIPPSSFDKLVIQPRPCSCR